MTNGQHLLSRERPIIRKPDRRRRSALSALVFWSRHRPPSAPLMRSVDNPTVLRSCALAGLAALCLIASSPTAFAHVKWFSHFDVAEQPVLLDQVISGAFCKLIALALFVFFVAALLDRSPFGNYFQRRLDWITAPIYHNIDTLMRATYGAFFVALWAKGHIILTPELKTTAAWVPWLQLAIAAGMLSRPTMILSGLGILVLFGYALAEYGAFHLLDYPIFLGAAAYLI